MKLHEHKEEFDELIAIVAEWIGIPSAAVRRDYYIVLLMQNLAKSIPFPLQVPDLRLFQKKSIPAVPFWPKRYAFIFLPRRSPFLGQVDA